MLAELVSVDIAGEEGRNWLLDMFKFVNEPLGIGGEE